MSCSARNTRLCAKSTVRSPIVFTWASSPGAGACAPSAPQVLPALRRPPHAREQLVHIERFAEIRVGPQIDQTVLFLNAHSSDADDQRLRAFPDALAEGQGMKVVRERSVQEDKVRRMHLHPLNSLLTIAGSLYFVPLQLEIA